MKPAQLLFEDGTSFLGTVFSEGKPCVSEVVFNTAMSGYQEVITDPSYAGQMVLMTYPLIGSYGINKDDIESRGLFLDALLVKEYIDFPSNFRSEKSLKTYLQENNVWGIEGLDTRAITRYIREKGAQKALLTTDLSNMETLLKQLQEAPGMVGKNLADTVTCEAPYVWQTLEKPLFKVAVIDCGVKYNILRWLSQRGCECHVFPSYVKPESLLDAQFNGIFVSNGPGDPEVVTQTIETMKVVLGKKPLFGICLGHQLMGLALGGKTYKLPFGHHGANHPVKNLLTGHVEITSQNHGFCIDMNSLNANEVEVTHLNLNDNTVEGIRHVGLKAFSVQYHPEAGPGPHDSLYLFDDFIALMKQHS